MSDQSNSAEGRCETCRFYRGVHLRDPSGACLRNPPQPIPTRAQRSNVGGPYEFTIKAGWPEVATHDFCGEYVARGEAS